MRINLLSVKNRYRVSSVVAVSLSLMLVTGSGAYAALTFTNDDITSDEDIAITGVANTADSVYIHANGGTSETIRVHADQGTGVASINLLSDVGGLNLQSGLASADAININASNASGGIDIDAGDSGITMNAVGGDISIGDVNTNGDINIGAISGSRSINLGGSGTTEILLTSADSAYIRMQTPLLVFHGNTPTASQSAGTPTIDANSSNVVGRVVTDTTAHTSVTITFTRPLEDPICVFSPGDAEAAAIMGSPTSAYATFSLTDFTINHASDNTSATWLYHCFGRYTPLE